LPPRRKRWARPGRSSRSSSGTRTCAVYNALVGYLLVHGEVEGLRALMFYFVAMAVHFAITDHALRRDHRETYKRVGRWILAAAIVAGWRRSPAPRASSPFWRAQSRTPRCC